MNILANTDIHVLVYFSSKPNVLKILHLTFNTGLLF